MRWYRENRHWWQPLKQAQAQAHRDGAAGPAGHAARGQDGRGR